MRNEPQVFRQNKLKNLMLFIISSVFVAIGILMLEDKALMGWFIISFFGLGIIVSLIQFHPNASYLKLTDEGFESKNMFRANFIKWNDVQDFRQGHINGNKMIFFDYTDEHKKWDTGKEVAKFMSGKEGAVQSSYNIPTDALLKLMIEYKLKSENEV